MSASSHLSDEYKNLLEDSYNEICNALILLLGIAQKHKTTAHNFHSFSHQMYTTVHFSLGTKFPQTSGMLLLTLFTQMGFSEPYKTHAAVLKDQFRENE